MTEIFVVAEVRDGKLKRSTLEAVGKAKALGGRVSAVLFGPEPLAKELGGGGAQRVFVVADGAFSNYCTEAYAAVLAQLIQQHQPSVVLGAATPYGKDLFPRVAARAGAGLATDCIEASLEGDRLTVTRPVYAGKARVAVTFSSKVQMATLRPNVFPVAPPQAASPEVVNVAPQLPPELFRARVKEVVKSGGGTIELTEASVIVSGGRGLKEAANFSIVEALAKELGAAVGASRAAVDAGWKPHPFQVGQTGKTVSPNIYIACGISGAIQHLAGMGSSKCIVAINKDANAPIFKVADYGIVGDLFEMVPALTAEAKRLKESS